MCVFLAGIEVVEEELDGFILFGKMGFKFEEGIEPDSTLKGCAEGEFPFLQIFGSFFAVHIILARD